MVSRDAHLSVPRMHGNSGKHIATVDDSVLDCQLLCGGLTTWSQLKEARRGHLDNQTIAKLDDLVLNCNLVYTGGWGGAQNLVEAEGGEDAQTRARPGGNLAR